MNEITPATFRDVFDRLERENARYVVISGIAVVLHGFSRLVADLDLVIDPAPAEADRAMRALMQAGFAPSLPVPLSLLTVMRMFDPSQREVDVFVRYSIPFSELWTGSERRSVGDGRARVMSLEHLLQERRSRGPAQDLRDIEGLLGREKK